MSLSEALTLRRTAREFGDTDLNIQELSNLLYSAGGVNRPEGKLVYPVGMGVQDTLIFAVMKDGIYHYDPRSHSLEQIEYGDHRAECSESEMEPWKEFMTGERPIPKDAAVQMGMFHSGAIMQNVYLFAASQNMNCVVQGSFDNAKLRELLKLNDTQTITLLQSLGRRP